MASRRGRCGSSAARTTRPIAWPTSWRQDGYDVTRRWTYLIVGTRTRDEAEALAKRVHGEVEAGGELVWEVMPRNPFAVFGGLGG